MTFLGRDRFSFVRRRLVGAITWVGAVAVALTAFPMIVTRAEPPKDPLALHIAPNGADRGDCLMTSDACATLQYAVDRVPQGKVAAIKLANGTYSGTVNVFYNRKISFSGNEKDPSKVVINNASADTCTFWIQDNATVALHGFTLTASAQRTTGLCGRQFAILDYGDIRFGGDGAPLGTGIGVSSMSIANCAGDIWVDAPLHVFFLLDHAQGTMGCHITIEHPQRIDYFLDATNKSIADVGSASFSGDGAGKGTTGIPYAVSDSTLTTSGVVLPGDAPGVAVDNAIVR